MTYIRLPTTSCGQLSSHTRLVSAVLQEIIAGMCCFRKFVLNGDGTPACCDAIIQKDFVRKRAQNSAVVKTLT